MVGTWDGAWFARQREHPLGLHGAEGGCHALCSLLPCICCYPLLPLQCVLMHRSAVAWLHPPIGLVHNSSEQVHEAASPTVDSRPTQHQE